MRFAAPLPVNKTEALRLLGYGTVKPDGATAAGLARAAADLAATARPRWASREFACTPGDEGVALAGTGLALPGHSIAAHLAGCHACVLLEVTLGGEADALVRAAEAADMQRAVLLDAAASALAEQYADEAERQLREAAGAKGLYLTGRFSPGYGDLPLQLQRELARLLDAPRAIGLTVAASGTLVPRKSITALLGLAQTPVTGRPAGCDACALRETCDKKKEGAACDA